MDDKKKLFIVIGILGVILLVLTVLTAILSRGSRQEQTTGGINVTPVQRGTTGGRITPQGEESVPSEATSVQDKQAQIEEIQNRSRELSTPQKVMYERAKARVPFETGDFEVDYAQSVDQFIVSEKTDNAQQETDAWLKANGLLEIARARPDLFPRVKDPLDEYLFLVDKFAQDPENLPPLSQPAGLQDGQSTDLQKDVQLLSDLLKTLLTLNLGEGTGSQSTQQVPSNLLDGQLGSPAGGALEKKDFVVSSCLRNVETYKQAEGITGVSWPVTAAMHYREGSCGTDRSVVSGELIGKRNPDRRSSECASASQEVGVPKRVAGGCGFTSLLDSAVFAANHLKGKIGGVAPTTVQQMAQAFGRYNGIGNRNCGKTPYSNCPPKFENDDHNYAMALFDSPHESMYVVYCANGRRCNPPRRDSRPGAATVVRLITGK